MDGGASTVGPPPRVQTHPRMSARPIFFMHVSSSGGTALCRWAQEQPCAQIPACGANCNMQCHHPWNWQHHCRPPACVPPAKPCQLPFKAAGGGCEGLARYARRRNLTFLASETMLPGYGRQCLEQYFFGVIVLRDPVERLQSQFVRFHPSGPNAALNAILSRQYAFNTTERSSLFGTASIDNYLTRLLLGPRAFFLPLRGINSSHRQAAARILESFQLTVPIENLSSASWLSRSLGFRGVLPKANTHSRHKRGLVGSGQSRAVAAGRRMQRATGTAGFSAAHPPHLGERSLRALRALNLHDAELVAQARARFVEQRARWADLPEAAMWAWASSASPKHPAASGISSTRRTTAVDGQGEPFSVACPRQCAEVRRSGRRL